MPVTEKKPAENYYTHRDYLETDEDYRAEILDGQMYVKSPLYDAIRI
jgi:hypothetical protein